MTSVSNVRLVGLEVADPAEAWEGAGFHVDRGIGSGDDGEPLCPVGNLEIRFGDHGTGIVGWSLSGLPQRDPPRDVDGVPTSHRTSTARRARPHPNGVTAIDHVVLMTPDLDRTVGSLTSIGVPPRRERDAEIAGRQIRQIFFRFGDVIVEVVGTPGATDGGPSSLWGITFTVSDIDATAAFFGERTAPVKDAVQPGRRITTLRHRDLGMSVRTAFISASR